MFNSLPLLFITAILASKLQSTNCRTHYYNQKNSREHYHKPVKGHKYHNHHDTINHISLPPFPSPLPSPSLPYPPLPSSPPPSLPSPAPLPSPFPSPDCNKTSNNSTSENPTNPSPSLPSLSPYTLPSPSPSYFPFLSPSPYPSSPSPSYNNSTSNNTTSNNCTSCNLNPLLPSPSPLPSPIPFPFPYHCPSASPLPSDALPSLPSPSYNNSTSSNSTSIIPYNSSSPIVFYPPLSSPSSYSPSPSPSNNNSTTSKKNISSTPNIFYSPSPSPTSLPPSYYGSTSNNYTSSSSPTISYHNSTSCNANSSSSSPLPTPFPSPRPSPSLPSPNSDNSTSSNSTSINRNNSSTPIVLYPPLPSPSPSPYLLLPSPPLTLSLPPSYYNSTTPSPSPSPSISYDNSTSCNSNSSSPFPTPLPSPSPSPSYNNSTSSNTTSKNPNYSPTPIHPPLFAPSPSPNSNNSTSKNPNNYATVIFNIKSYGAIGNGSNDDTKAIRSAWKAACQVENAVLLVPCDGIFMVTSTTFTGPCQPGFVFQIDGVLMPPDGPDCWPNSDSRKQWIVFYRADNMTLQGEGTIEGNGENWWNLPCKPHRGPNGSTLPGPCDSPALIRYFMSNNVTVKGLSIENSPQFHMKFDNCNDVHIDSMWINSPSFSPNTDGIHIENTTSVEIYNSRISNGDDCISIGAGCADVHIQNVTCGPGHGISIGSLGEHNSHACVSNITARNVRIHNSDNGVRIKTWQGGTGSVSGIIFDTIVMENVRNCINIDQYYCMANNKCENQTSAIYVSDVSYSNIKGTYNIKSPPVHFACSDSVPCSNITLSEVELLPSEGEKMEGPFCWNTYGTLATLTIPPIYCLQEGRPQSLQESLVTGC